MRLREIMAESPVTISSRDTAYRAAQLMRDRDVEALVIMDGDAVVGVLTDRDLTVRCLASGDDPVRGAVSHYMTGVPATVLPSMDVKNAALLFIEHRVRYLPVMKDRQLVGIVSLMDVAQALGVAVRDLQPTGDKGKRAA